ncbi:MAG: efflux RND transporter periplasmic adaptor subunit [Planctomycetia bacterium]|nr:efflux RND transporter periplasmic adaptor subunit [Planctomycetia bacterium]
MAHYRGLLAAGCLPLLLAVGGLGCQQPAAPPELVRPVKTLVVSASAAPHTRVFPGKVEASRRAELAFQVPGVLVKLPVKEGQKVAKGELIAQLRLDEFQARLQTLKGQLDQQRAQLQALRAGDRPEQRLRLEAQVRAAAAKMAQARANFDRDARLVRSSAVSREEFERSEAAFRVAREDHQAAVQSLEKGTVAREEDIAAQEGVVRALENQVVEANIQLQDTTLLAPYDGVIAQRFVEVNQNIRAKEPVVKFQDVDEIDVAVDVPEAVMAADLRAADILQIAAEFSGAPGVQFPVRVRELAQVADPATQTFRVRVALQAPPSGVNLLPGMTATVAMTYRRASILDSRILVPVTAIYKDSKGEQVAWIIGADGTVARRPVKLGAVAGGQVEVLGGLQPGDRVAVAGVTFLREGMKVRDLGDALGGG